MEPTSERRPVTPPPVVCIVGVAESFTSAYASSLNWPGFHSFWVVDGMTARDIRSAYIRAGIPLPTQDIANVLDGKSIVFQVLQPEWEGKGPSWQSAVNSVLQYTRVSGYPCEYFFLMHDRSSWFLNPSFKETTERFAFYVHLS